MSIYVPMFVKQRDMIMYKADLVITDYKNDDYYRFDYTEREDFGIILGFTCGNNSYDSFDDALDSPEALREVISVRVLWSKGDITNELAPCLSVISSESR